MRRLILTNDVSGAGCLKLARVGDMAIAISMLGAQIGLARYSIVGPLPTEGETAEFFGPQQSRDSIFWQSGRGPVRPKEEMTGSTTVSEFGGLRDRQRDYIDWVLKSSVEDGVAPEDGCPVDAVMGLHRS